LGGPQVTAIELGSLFITAWKDVGQVGDGGVCADAEPKTATATTAPRAEPTALIGQD
jgi:hypothetical protein